MTLTQSAERARVVLVNRGPRMAAPAWEQLIDTLPPSERLRIEQLHRWEDRQESALGWQLLRQLTDERGRQLSRAADGRPGCRAPGDVSLSHSGGWVAAAVSDTGRIGVDVETVREVSAGLARRCLSDSELAWLDRAASTVARSLRFIALWTAKEAYLKAVGVGLALDPREVVIDYSTGQPRLLGTLGDRWQLSSSSPTPDTRVALCIERPE